MGSLFGFLSWSVAQGLVRNALLSTGAILVTNGYLSQSNLNDGVGAILVIAGIIFSAISNRKKAEAVAVVTAVEAHPAITVIPASETLSGRPIVNVKPSASPPSGMPPKSLAGGA